MQTGKKKYHQISGFTPYVHKSHCRQYRFFIGENTERFQTDSGKQLIEHSRFRHIDEKPNARNRYHRHNDGIKKRRTEKADKFHILFVDKHGKHKSDDKSRHNGQHGKVQRIAHDFPKQFTLREFDIIMQSDKLRLRHTDFERRQSEISAFQYGPDGKYKHKEQRRSKHEPAFYRIVHPSVFSFLQFHSYSLQQGAVPGVIQNFSKDSPAHFIIPAVYQNRFRSASASFCASASAFAGVFSPVIAL